MRSTRSMLTFFLIATAAVAGCSQAEPPRPAPKPQPPRDAPVEVPKVRHAKNLDAVSHACQLLKPEQLAMVGLAGVEPTGYQHSCRWDDGHSNEVSISTYDLPLKESLNRLGKARPDGDVFGYPVTYSSITNYAGSGSCQVEAAASDEGTLAVQVSGMPYSRDSYPCKIAETVIEMALSNVPGGH